MAVLCAIQCIHCSSYDSSVGVQTTQPQMCENCRGLGAAGVHVGMGVPQMIHWEEGDDLTDSFRLFGGGQGDPLCLWPDILGAGSQGHCRGPTTACVSQAQHLFQEVCADSPAPRHKLFLAVVTVHCSHENRNSSPCLVLPWDTTPGARAAGTLGLGTSPCTASGAGSWPRPQGAQRSLHPWCCGRHKAWTSPGQRVVK